MCEEAPPTPQYMSDTVLQSCTEDSLLYDYFLFYYVVIYCLSSAPLLEYKPLKASYIIFGASNSAGNMVDMNKHLLNG